MRYPGVHVSKYFKSFRVSIYRNQRGSTKHVIYMGFEKLNFGYGDEDWCIDYGYNSFIGFDDSKYGENFSIVDMDSIFSVDYFRSYLQWCYVRQVIYLTQIL